MTYGEFAPSPLLAPFVECYWTVTFSRSRSPFKPLEILIPDGRTEIIFNDGAAYSKFRDHSCQQYDTVAGSHVIGMREKAIFLENMHGVHFFCIRFRPGGLCPFTRYAAQEFTQQHIDLSALFGPMVRETEERIFEASTTQRKIQLAENMLFARLKNTTSPANPLSAMLSDIYAHKGQYSIDELSQKYDMGYKKMERYFQKTIGCSPKLFMKMVRFNHAIHMLQSQPELSMTDIAYEASYYDQAHFNREFRSFIGNTPGSFRKRQYTIARVICPKLNFQPAPCYQI